jgi:hypothetical protein
MAKANKLLLQGDYPLIASPTLAKAYGVASALFLQKLHYCLQSNDVRTHNKKRFWFHTLQDWVTTLGVYSVSTIKRVIAKLKKDGILVVKKLSCSSWVQTNYYSIDYKKLKELFQPQLTDDLPAPHVKARVSNEPLPAPLTPEKNISGTPEPVHAPAAPADLANQSVEYRRFYFELRRAKVDVSHNDPRIQQWLSKSSTVIRQIYYQRQGSLTPAYWHTAEQLQLNQYI